MKTSPLPQAVLSTQDRSDAKAPETSVNWQPNLIGSSLRLRPLSEKDYEALYAAASDPLIWELHPDSKRYTPERFEPYFRSGLESRGALAIIDLKSGRIVGSSRYTSYNRDNRTVEIGYTFLTRDYWGGPSNLELKTLMLDYAFQSVETAYFVVGKDNLRSRGAMRKIGGTEVLDVAATPVSGDLRSSVVYQIKKHDWITQDSAVLPAQPWLTTPRLILEPITKEHAKELCELFRDPELHRYTPFEPIGLEAQLERCTRWEGRRSPDGREVWFNWFARTKAAGAPIGHFQVGIKPDGVAEIGYLVAISHQRKGYSTEAIESIFTYLREVLGVSEVRAFTDSRNTASHRLAHKLGMIQVEYIKNADFFKGASSDEIVFSRRFVP